MHQPIQTTLPDQRAGRTLTHTAALLSNGAPAAAIAAMDAAALRDYRATLQRHDWAFEWSDDSRVYAEGRDRLAWLRRVQLRIDPDFAIWNSLAPAAYRSCDGNLQPTKADLLGALKALIDAADDSLDRSALLQGAKARAYTLWAQAGGEQ